MVVRMRMVMAVCGLALMLAGQASDKPEKMPKDFKGGGKDSSVKDWGGKNFEQIKGVAGLYAIYIYDDGRKNNAEAFKLECKEILGSKEVQEALSKFTKIKIKEDAKGWPEQWTKDAKGAASLILMTSDMQIAAFDKHKTNAEMTGPLVIAAAAQLKAHEESVQKSAKLHAKEKDREAAERAEREKVAAASKPKSERETVEDAKDLGIAALDKKTDTKPPEKAKTDKKAPADKKVADAKKDDKKMPTEKKDDKKVVDGKAADSKDPKKKATPDDE